QRAFAVVVDAMRMVGVELRGGRAADELGAAEGTGLVRYGPGIGRRPALLVDERTRRRLRQISTHRDAQHVALPIARDERHVDQVIVHDRLADAAAADVADELAQLVDAGGEVAGRAVGRAPAGPPWPDDRCGSRRLQALL